MTSKPIGEAYPDSEHSFHPRQCANIWLSPPSKNWRRELADALRQGIESHIPRFYFRADAIGAGGRPFEALCTLFRKHEVPLAMAVVPAWLSASRCNNLFEVAPLDEPLWNWHQHGWRHVDWQKTGKKSEFGAERSYEKQLRDISLGKEKMNSIFAPHLLPVFTPPWNHLSSTTIEVVRDLNFKGVSMMGPFPRGIRPGNELKNLRVQIVLHTRKRKHGQDDFRFLCEELTSWIGRREPVGVVLHHQHMNGFAFEFLDELLHLLKHQVGARLLSFREILEKSDDV